MSDVISKLRKDFFIVDWETPQKKGVFFLNLNTGASAPIQNVHQFLSLDTNCYLGIKKQDFSFDSDWIQDNKEIFSYESYLKLISFKVSSKPESVLIGEHIVSLSEIDKKQTTLKIVTNSIKMLDILMKYHEQMSTSYIEKAFGFEDFQKSQFRMTSKLLYSLISK